MFENKRTFYNFIRNIAECTKLNGYFQSEKYFADKNAEDVFYCGYDRIETYIPRDNKDFFIGMQIDEFDNPTVPSAVKSIEYLNELNLPTNFKKKYTYFFTTLAIKTV